MVKDYAAITCPGAVRQNNEDTYVADPGLKLFVVADGMGGHSAGEVAAAIAAYQIRQEVAAGTDLTPAIIKAHEDIVSCAKARANHMGSTVVAYRGHNDKDFQISWVGDSRAYLWDFSDGANNLELITRDHSFVQTLVDQGSISETDAKTHPQRHIITQCLGHQSKQPIRVDSVAHKWREDQWVILCSDGLNGDVSDQAIADTLAECSSLQDAVNALEELAMAAGGNDNITIVIISSPKSANVGSRWWRKLASRISQALAKQ